MKKLFFIFSFCFVSIFAAQAQSSSTLNPGDITIQSGTDWTIFSEHILGY